MVAEGNQTITNIESKHGLYCSTCSREVFFQCSLCLRPMFISKGCLFASSMYVCFLFVCFIFLHIKLTFCGPFCFTVFKTTTTNIDIKAFKHQVYTADIQKLDKSISVLQNNSTGCSFTYSHSCLLYGNEHSKLSNGKERF